MNVTDKSAPISEARPRARKTARSWGDINLTLNRLVREGVIATFKTNLSSPDRTGGVSVVITPGLEGEAETARLRVANDLDALIEGVTVTVEERQAA